MATGRSIPSTRVVIFHRRFSYHRFPSIINFVSVNMGTTAYKWFQKFSENFGSIRSYDGSGGDLDSVVWYSYKRVVSWG
jgi:hypothetical protein